MKALRMGALSNHWFAYMAMHLKVLSKRCIDLRASVVLCHLPICINFWLKNYLYGYIISFPEHFLAKFNCLFYLPGNGIRVQGKFVGRYVHDNI